MDEELLNSIAGAPTEKWRHKVTFAGISKRAFDLCASLAALIVLSPVFGIIALRIKRDSPGPVYFRGQRVGRYGKPFQILKFRTMYETPESYEASAMTRNDDPRVTPFGQWLRQTKLNELPHLWPVM